MTHISCSGPTVQNVSACSHQGFIVPPRTGQMPSWTGVTEGDAHLQQDGEKGELLPHVRLQGSLSGRWGDPPVRH